MPFVFKLCQPGKFRIILISLSVLSCVAALISFIISMLTEETKIIILPRETFYLPPYYSVNSNYDTPSKEECSNSRKSWIFTFISLIEAFYRKQSIENGRLSVNSYAQFSEQYLLTAFRKFCKNSQNSRFCNFKETSNGTDGSISMIPEILNNSKEFRKGIVPFSVCPNSCESEECSNYPQENKNLEFSFSVDEWAQTSKDIKELIYKQKKPLMFQMPEPLRQVYSICQSTDQTCINKSILCPDYLYNESLPSTRYCSVTTSKTYTGSGEFFVPEYLEAGDPINFLIVGYSDSFVSSKGKANVNYMKYSKGGFIAKSSHSKQVGSTINYYLGKQSMKEAFSMCPNYRAPQHWIGIDPDDFANGDYGDGTALECINKEVCGNGTYFIGKQLIQTKDLYLIQEQQDKVYAIMMTTESRPLKFTKKLIENLDEAFLPKKRKEESVNDACGYWFIPYELVDRMTRLNRDIRSRTIAISASVTFENPSSTLKSLISSNTKTAPQRAETTVI